MIPDDELQAMCERHARVMRAMADPENAEPFAAIGIGTCIKSDLPKAFDEIDRLKSELASMTERRQWLSEHAEQIDKNWKTFSDISLGTIYTAIGKDCIPDVVQEIERIQAELAAKEIRWTDAKPTTPGWWWRRVGEGHEASCAFVGTVWEPGELLAQLHRHSGLWKIENLEGQWSDKPIPQPEERT